MWRIYAGGVAMLAGIATFIEAARQRPFPPGYFSAGVRGAPSRLSPTAYDLLHVAGWALLIGGFILVVMGLIRYSAALRA